MKMSERVNKNISSQKERGQSLVEVALTFPILLVLLSGLIEFGFILNHYLAIVDATREVARISSNWNHEYIDPDTGNSFYETAIGKVVYALEPNDENDTTRKIKIRENRVNCSAEDAVTGVCDNEIIISVYGISESGVSLVAKHYWDDSDPRQESRIDEAVINERIAGIDNTSAGVVVVEVFYNYEQVLGLPWVPIQDPLLLYSYTIMPLSSAEPES